MVCRGYAASMGGILLQAGDVRVCGPESYILIHEISSGAVGKIGDLEDEVEFVKMIQKRVNDIFVARSGGKVTATKLRNMYRRKDFWLDSTKALALGIVDEIR
jgi:ATP-dependent protease ClpP protease subunit